MQPSLKPKVFTIEEANKLIPMLEGSFERINDLNYNLQILSGDLKDLVNTWGDAVFGEKNPDNSYYKDLLAQRDYVTEELSRRITTVQSLGCIVKDVEKGLVDFYHKRGEKTILLCWQH